MLTTIVSAASFEHVVAGRDPDRLGVEELRPAGDHHDRVDRVEHGEVLAAQGAGQGAGVGHGLAVALARRAGAGVLGVVDERLRRHAPDVDARPAVHPGRLLDHGHPLAEPSHRRGERLAALPESDHEQVEVRVHHALIIRRAARAGHASSARFPSESAQRRATASRRYCAGVVPSAARNAWPKADSDR
ncbi:hypothetical protein QP939_36955 [Amycolatopsis nalaikhensis]|uniref:Uncharacterized protein n=1 Tax=Amycolatopsis nalaikhensis TaxID=715472 RepID=A0ABY8XFN0_9PSEU|nr:hypothetical protein [Amycolatopsis sp. 2-2]WIV54411.1 hypothetical protein QP939_36955 [Amycolatopsis sp. 2-2]